MPSSKKLVPERASPRVVYSFDNGQTHSVPLTKVTATLLRQFEALRQSDDPQVAEAASEAYDKAVSQMVAAQVVAPAVRAAKSIPAVSASNAARSAVTQDRVRKALEDVPKNRASRPAGWIAEKTGLSDTTVRKCLKEIRLGKSKSSRCTSE